MCIVIHENCKNSPLNNDIKYKTHKFNGESCRYCRAQGCTKQATYGFEINKSLYCRIHKEDGMINVKNKRCEQEGCMTESSFGYEGEKAQYCGKHNKDKMINVKNKRCEY
ncbi:Hypothetical protein HVR_LOCUS944 [uncultured virus]|nr:Hypothetical protein HVR_LOCUS944 [uncultured virus]